MTPSNMNPGKHGSHARGAALLAAMLTVTLVATGNCVAVATMARSGSGSR